MPLNEEIPDTKKFKDLEQCFNLSLGASWHNA